MLQVAGGLVLGAVGLWFLLFVFVALMALSEPKPKWKKKYGEETVDPSGIVWTNMGKVNSRGYRHSQIQELHGHGGKVTDETEVKPEAKVSGRCSWWRYWY